MFVPLLVFSLVFFTSYTTNAAVLVLPSQTTEIRYISHEAVLKKAEAYNKFLSGLFSDQSGSHSFDMSRAYVSAGRDRVRQSLGPQLLGVNSAFNHAPFFKGGAQMLWICGVLFSILQITQDLSLLPQWVFVYPIVVDSILRLAAASTPGLLSKTIQSLMRTLKFPLEHTQLEGRVWYQLGGPINEETPRIVEALVSFDVLERLVTKVFSNGEPNRYGGQIEKFLFRYANRFKPALKGWLFRYLQANPDGLRGLDRTDTTFPWQKAFELHLRSRPLFWRPILQSLGAEVPDGDTDIKKSIAQLESDLDSIPSVWSGTKMVYQRGCEFLLQWVSDFRR